MDDLSGLTARLPADLRQRIAGMTWEENQIGWSGVRVFRLDGPHGSGQYLKIAQPPHDLTPEKQRLEWLQGRLPVPQLLNFTDDPAGQFLLMSAIPGLVAFDDQFRDRRAQIIELLADGLRQIHRVEIAGCPFDRRVAALIEQARSNIVAGRVGGGDFEANHDGRSAHDLLAEAIAIRPAEEDLVFTHGDYCLPNVLIDADSMIINGYVDWGQAGVADRYYDLAFIARSIVYNFGEEWVAPFWEAYGVTEVDHARIAFFRLIDELLWITE
jgi:aminoglycoside phosphotransferase